MIDNNYDSKTDYLTEDSNVRGQKYCCISFLEPTEDVQKHVEIFIFNKYLKHIAKNFTFSPRLLSKGSVSLEISEKQEKPKEIEVKEVIEQETNKLGAIGPAWTYDPNVEKPAGEEDRKSTRLNSSHT